MKMRQEQPLTVSINMAEWVEVHLPCPKCSSSDAMSINDRGWGKCFSCGSNIPPDYDDDSAEVIPLSKSLNFVDNLEYSLIESRHLSKSICQKWGYGFGEKHGKKCHVANFYDKDRKLIGQKLRYPDKSFEVIGKIDTLYGKHLWLSGGKTIIITEGELDALSVSEANGGKYPVVSIPSGSSGAKSVLLKEREWLESNFEKIILLFDQDKAGRQAVEECAPIFTPSKIFVGAITEKDASECLVKGKVSELITVAFNAKPYRPDGICLIDDIKEQKVEWGLSSPYPSLTKWTYGFRSQELYTLGAGTGIGKTTLLKELIVNFRINHNEKVGILFLEEAASHTVNTLAGIVMSKAIHVPDTIYSESEKQEAINKLKGKDGDGLVFYNHFGHTDFDTIRNTIRHMVVAYGCKWIFLDHITAIVQGEDNIDQKLGKYISTLASMIRELDVSLFMVSHLNTPGGDQSHEEGARVTLKNLYGSRAIAQWSNFVFALERNQQDPEYAHVTTLRVLKDRYTGSSTGNTCMLEYNLEDNHLKEIDWVL